VAKKKRSKKKKAPRSYLLSPQEEAQLASLLKDLHNLTPENLKDQIPTPGLAMALVEKLPPEADESIAVLVAVRQAFEQKNVQKAVKKAIFRFRQKGISHPDLEPEKGGPISLRKRELDKPSAYLGPIDGTGTRGILIMLQQVPRGVDVGMGIVSDEDGIVQFLYGRYSKKRSKEVKEVFFSNFPRLIETSIAHAAAVLEKAYGINPELNEYSRDYLELRPWIQGNVAPLERPPIYELISPQDLPSHAITASQIERLLDHELMKSWIVFDKEKMTPLAEEIRKVEESPILVSETQRVERIDEITRKAIGEIFPPEKRSQLKERLEEMAYFFFESEERELARLSLVAASTIEEKDSMLQVDPFLEAIVKRSLDYYEAMEEAGSASEANGSDTSTPIITP